VGARLRREQRRRDGPGLGQLAVRRALPGRRGRQRVPRDEPRDRDQRRRGRRRRAADLDGFDELDKLGKLPNQVYVCRPGARTWSGVFSGATGATAEGVEGRQSLTALALGPKDALFAAYEGQAGPFVSRSGSGGGKDGSSKPTTVGGQGLGGRVLGRPMGLVVDASGVPTIALTNRGFGNTTGDSEDFREIVVKTCKGC